MMVRATNPINSPGIEPVPLPEESAVIGGRSATWRQPAPRDGDDEQEPHIVRGRE